ncbi:hypothetical protein Syun_004818 [Stephania yunnanensis]|uniref:Pentatricopeptide repeat-containing protein n=1 Tax=Stephania yunnanensis TaxID=152371 RepID=A0AAP0Q5B7_9MAGN
MPFFSCTFQILIRATAPSITHTHHCPLQLILKRGVSTQLIYSCNVKIGSLCRAGKIQYARNVFDEMPTRDVVTWNAMITGYWQNGLIEESKRLFELMPERNVVSWNSMIAGCVDDGRIEEAYYEYFRRMPKRNTASWNAMISGFVRFDRVEEAEELFEAMPSRNVVSFTAMIDGYARIGEVERARALFDCVPKKNDVTWAVMISGYVDNGKVFEAKELFDVMPEKNVVATTAMITGYFKEGMAEQARDLFEGIQHRDLVSWNAMIAGYEQNGNCEEALKLYLQLLAVGIKPDHSTLVSVLTACSSLSCLKEGRQAHGHVVKEGFEPNISVCNALITMYSKCGLVQDSEAAFRQLKTSDDLVSWNTIIAGYAQHGHYEKAISLFTDINSTGLKPDGITFLSLLSACGHAGKVNESLEWFNSMIAEYGIEPRVEHYACVIHTLCRAGQLEKAFHLIREMPFEADAGVWGALLAACWVFLNVELGEFAARRLLDLQPENSGTYVMLSNIYAAVGNWRGVMEVRGLMKEQGVKKQPGYSWIEFGNKVHFFLGDDISHPEIGNIHSELQGIYLQMKASDDLRGSFVDLES